MSFSRSHENLSTTAPDHNYAIEVMSLLKFLNISPNLVSKIALGFTDLYVWTIEAFNVLTIKNSWPRPNL